MLLFKGSRNVSLKEAQDYVSEKMNKQIFREKEGL